MSQHAENNEQATTPVTKTIKNVQIKERDVITAYLTDEMPIAEIAEHYGIDWADMKKVLMDFSIPIRRDGEVRPEPAKPYSISLFYYDRAKKTHSETPPVDPKKASTVVKVDSKD